MRDRRCSLVLGDDGFEVIHRVEPLAHVPALPALELDLLFAQRLEQHEGDAGVEGSDVHPDWQKSLSHDGGEVALSDVDHVGGGVN